MIVFVIPLVQKRLVRGSDGRIDYAGGEEEDSRET